MTPREINNLLIFLSDTLIPDLTESGKHYLADDFNRCIKAIDQLTEENVDLLLRLQQLLRLQKRLKGDGADND